MAEGGPLGLDELLPGDVIALSGGRRAVYLDTDWRGRIEVMPESGPDTFDLLSTHVGGDELESFLYRLGVGDEVLIRGRRRGRVESIKLERHFDNAATGMHRRFGRPTPSYEVRPRRGPEDWEEETVRRMPGELSLLKLAPAAGVAATGGHAVGDFVIINGEKLGRVERVVGDEFAVRSLMPKRRWAMHTTVRAGAELAPAGHDYVRAHLGLDVTEPPPPPGDLPAEPELPPEPARPARYPRASPATERSLAARVLRRRAAAAAPAPAPTAPTVAPMPIGELHQEFARLAFDKPFRRYQALALAAVNGGWKAGRRRAYLVMPPGSGKSAVGLEIARRLGNRTLVLGPNTAIQGQWIEQWRAFAPDGPAAGTDPDLTAAVSVLTYQAICNIESHNPDLDEQVATLHGTDTGDRYVSSDMRRKARLLALQGGEHDQLLGILHPNGRRLIERIVAGGQWTIVLDECHHLLEMWGYLLRALAHELGDRVFLVGLTATPPGEMEAREAVLYRELFGSADFEVTTPAVVKEGNLAPYQELAYLTTPLAHEAEYIEGERIRFQELVTALLDPRLGTVSFLDWFQGRFLERRTPQGAQVGWDTFEAAQPRLAQAVLRFCHSYEVPVPAGARLREGDRQDPGADDWVYLIDDYCVGHLRGSEDRSDLDAWDLIRAALPSLGYALGYHGVRSYISPVDRVLMLSAAKGAAACEILAAEAAELGSRLRALVICDYEVAGTEVLGRLHGILDPQAGSAALVLRTLVADARARALDPILVTGRSVACSRASVIALGAHLGRELTTSALLADPGAGWEELVEVRPMTGSWESRDYVPAVTAFLEAGGSRCLIGTRGLLGEGWDAKSVNVLIDLTGVTTTTAVHQLRGRTLRLDPELPRKVADNWDVVCIAPDHPLGMADYSRFVRKHRNYFGLTETGEIESGVSHVDGRLSPFGPPPPGEYAGLNSRLLGQPARRDAVYLKWGVGRSYLNSPTQTVRVRFGRSPGLAKAPLKTSVAGVDPPSFFLRLVGTLVGGSTIYGLGLATGYDLFGLEGGLIAVALGLGVTARSLRDYLARIGPSGALENLAAAVGDGLATADLIDGRLGAAAVRVVPQPDGYYRCYLDGASLPDSETFAAALDELLAPIGSPRYIVPRYVAGRPTSTLGAIALLLKTSSNPRWGRTVVYHAVPSMLATDRERVAAFGAAWNRHVSAGRPLFERDPEAQAIIQLQRGEDPFAVTTQMRTLWQ